MKVSPRRFLAVALAVAVPAVICRRPAEPDAPGESPGAAAMADGCPETAGLRVAAKRLVARDAAAGRRSLAEAAALFAALNRLPPETTVLVAPDSPARPLRHLPGRTDAELLCLQVIVHAAMAQPGEPPDHARAVGDRLEAAYLAAVRDGGVIRLPDPSTLEPVEKLKRQARAWIAGQDERRAARAGQGSPGGEKKSGAD